MIDRTVTRMSLIPRHVCTLATAGIALAMVGCASTQPSSQLVDGSQTSVEGTISSVDIQPWTYDGYAVVVLATASHGLVKVQLPARWNLCKAPAVDVESLVVGGRAHAVGNVTAEGDLVVCESADHRLLAD